MGRGSSGPGGERAGDCHFIPLLCGLGCLTLNLSFLICEARVITPQKAGVSILGELTLYLTFNYLGLCLTLLPDSELLEDGSCVCLLGGEGGGQKTILIPRPDTHCLVKKTRPEQLERECAQRTICAPEDAGGEWV